MRCSLVRRRTDAPVYDTKDAVLILTEDDDDDDGEGNLLFFLLKIFTI